MERLAPISTQNKYNNIEKKYNGNMSGYTVYPRKYAHGLWFVVLCCGYALADFPISIRLTSLVLWQFNDCPNASKATLMTMDKYFMRIHYERLHNHNKAKHNKTVCIFLGIYCTSETDTMDKPAIVSANLYIYTFYTYGIHTESFILYLHSMHVKWYRRNYTCLYTKSFDSHISYEYT